MADRLTAQYTGAVKANLIECDVAGTPTVGGDYVKQYTSPAIYRVSSVTDTLTTDHFGRVDPTALTEVVLEKATLPNIDSDQLFVKDSLAEWLLYNAPQTGDCLSKVEKYMGFIEPLAVEEGSLLVDEGEMIVYKEGVTQ